MQAFSKFKHSVAFSKYKSLGQLVNINPLDFITLRFVVNLKTLDFSKYKSLGF